jgi:Gti1/Pac2 family transcription factor
MTSVSNPAFFNAFIDIRTAQDAHRVFEAVRLGILPLIRRRLSPSERDLLSSGQVFVWEEAPTGSAAGDEANITTSGLERWTDGRRWYAFIRPPPSYFHRSFQPQVPITNEGTVSLLRRKSTDHS